eukprot:767603-Hanusia_phi.AAC.4
MELDEKGDEKNKQVSLMLLSVFDDHLLALPSSCSEYEDGEDFASQVRRWKQANLLDPLPAASFCHRGRGWTGPAGLARQLLLLPG